MAAAVGQSGGIYISQDHGNTWAAAAATATTLTTTATTLSSNDDKIVSQSVSETTNATAPASNAVLDSNSSESFSSNGANTTANEDYEEEDSGTVMPSSSSEEGVEGVKSSRPTSQFSTNDIYSSSSTSAEGSSISMQSGGFQNKDQERLRAIQNANKTPQKTYSPAGSGSISTSSSSPTPHSHTPPLISPKANVSPSRKILLTTGLSAPIKTNPDNKTNPDYDNSGSKSS